MNGWYSASQSFFQMGTRKSALFRLLVDADVIDFHPLRPN